MTELDERQAGPAKPRNLLIVLQELLAGALGDTCYPRENRGQTLVSLGDFSGSHDGARFNTYAFLHFDLERNARWRWLQQSLRTSKQLGRRRMSFKSLNDKIRQRALPGFLQAADEIEGALNVFAIAKEFGPFVEVTAESASAHSCWSPMCMSI